MDIEIPGVNTGNLGGDEVAYPAYRESSALHVERTTTNHAGE